MLLSFLFPLFFIAFCSRFLMVSSAFCVDFSTKNYYYKTILKQIILRRFFIMKTVQISLNSIDKVKSFVNAITQYEYDFDLISGRYVIDAKSIMGIFSLDLSKPIDLAIHAENNMDEIMETLKPYLI